MIKVNRSFGHQGQNMEITASQVQPSGKWRVTVRNTCHGGLTWRHAFRLDAGTAEYLIGKVSDAVSDGTLDFDRQDDAGHLWARILPNCNH